MSPRTALCGAAGLIAGVVSAAAHAPGWTAWLFIGGLVAGLVIADITRKAGDRS